MCGRYVHPDTAAMERAWHIGAHNQPIVVTRQFNVAPTAMVPILCRDGSDIRVLKLARWAFVPHWWKQPKPPAHTFNARSEEAAAKPMWRDAFRNGSRHCLIPAESWYEWQTIEQVDEATGEIHTIKQPYAIYPADHSPFCFAGLLSAWQPSPTLETILTCSILTQAASPDMVHLHARMPVVLRNDLLDAWTAPDCTKAETSAALIAQSVNTFAHHAVSRRVNSVRNNSADLLDPEVVSP